MTMSDELTEEKKFASTIWINIKRTQSRNEHKRKATILQGKG